MCSTFLDTFREVVDYHVKEKQEPKTSSFAGGLTTECCLLVISPSAADGATKSTGGQNAGLALKMGTMAPEFPSCW